MTLFDKIIIRKRLKSKDVIRVSIDHDITKKDVIDYYFKMLPKYGFKMINKGLGSFKVINNGLDDTKRHVLSVWCHPKRASKSMVYKPDVMLYADNSVISNLSKKPMCEGCVCRDKCREGGDYLNG